jgi:ribokinase
MAACAARLGAATRFFGKVGRDAFGEGFVRLLEQEKIDGGALLFSDTKPTAVGFIIFSGNGSNVIVIDTAANGEFSPADITAHRDVITSSAVAVSPLEIPLATALAAASVAKAAGTKFILNPAPAMDLRNADLSAVFALTPNELEARVCLGLRPDDPISDNEVVLELLRLGVDNVMLTRGGKGVIWGCPAGLVEVPAVPVVVVDTVGAGDAFNAGLAVGLSEKKSTLQAIALGVTAASLSTQRRETIASYAYRAEVDLFYEKTLRAAFAVEPQRIV